MRKLWPHQQKISEYMDTTRHPALFVEMRLGKTIPTIRNIVSHSPRNRRVLVCGPSSILPGWEMELKRENQNAISLVGKTKRKRQKALKHFESGWIVLNAEGWRSIPEVKDMPWDAVVLDESFIRNPKAQVTKFFLKNFRDVSRRFLLTGTPSPEGLLDYVCQFLWLHGSFMGFKNFWGVRSKFFHPVMYDYVPNQGVEKKIIKYVSDHAFVMTRKEVKIDVPKIYESRFVELPAKAKREYNGIEDFFCSNLLDDETENMGKKLSWMHGIIDGFYGENLSVPYHTKKIDELENLLFTELAGTNQSIVVWFTRNAPIRYLEAKHRDKYCESITGDTPIAERSKRIKRFQEGKTRILLLQTKCATYGLNLSKADTAIYYSQPLSLIERMQTEDRITYLGKKGVLIIDLITQDTIEEMENDLIHTKKHKQVTRNRIIEYIQKKRGITDHV